MSTDNRSIYWNCVSLVLLLAVIGTTRAQDSGSDFQGTVNITSVAWDSNFSVSNSEAFRNLSTRLVEQIHCAFVRNQPNLLDKPDVQGFTENGGVIATFILHLNGTRNTSEVVEIAKNITNGCRTLGDMNITNISIRAFTSVNTTLVISTTAAPVPTTMSGNTTMAPSTTAAPVPTTTMSVNTTMAPSTTAVLTTTMSINTTMAPSTTAAPVPTTSLSVNTTIPPSTTGAPVPTTTMSSSTALSTESSTTSPDVKYVVGGSIRITSGVTWDDKFSNETSKEYEYLKIKVLDLLTKIYGGALYGQRFVGVTDITFSNGSVIVSFKVNYVGDDPINTTALSSVIINNTNNFGNFTVDPASISHTVSVQPSTAAPTTSTTAAPPGSTEKATAELLVPPWGIAVIVCGSLVLIFLLTMLAILCTRRQTRMMKYRMSDDMDPDDIGYRRSWGNGETNYGYDNKQEAITTNEEMKQPMGFFDVGNNFKDTEGLDPDRSFTVADHPNGYSRFSANSNDFFRTFYDEDSATWETHL